MSHPVRLLAAPPPEAAHASPPAAPAFHGSDSGRQLGLAVLANLVATTVLIRRPPFDFASHNSSLFDIAPNGLGAAYSICGGEPLQVGDWRGRHASDVGVLHERAVR